MEKTKKEQKEIENENSRKLLEEIEKQIIDLEKHRVEIEEPEKTIFIFVRLVVCILLIVEVV